MSEQGGEIPQPDLTQKQPERPASPRTDRRNAERRSAERRSAERRDTLENQERDAVFADVRSLHEAHADDTDFRDRFYKNTASALKRMKAILPSRAEVTAFEDEELSIAAEVEATFLTQEEIRRVAAEKESITDSLTGVYNLRGFNDNLEETIRHIAQTEPHISTTIAQFDLDHFKYINDGIGHPGGDKIIKGAVDLVRKVLTDAGLDDSVIGRVGGEEFCIILKRNDIEQARQIIETIRTAMPAFLKDRITPNEYGKLQSHPLSASWGLAAITPDSSIEQARESVDLALYHAKDTGRNRTVALSDVDPTILTSEKLALHAIQLAAAEEEQRERARKATLPPPRWIQPNGEA
jgi:diguanylate cyclase (GGDEF)-like protein